MATTKINEKTMLNYEDLTDLSELVDVVKVSNKGVATYTLKDEFGNEQSVQLLKGVTGLYSNSKEENLDYDDMVNYTRIHGNNLELSLQNGVTVIVEDYFKNNGKSSFKYVLGKDENGETELTDLIEDAKVYNLKFYNEYNLAELHDTSDGAITTSKITGTAFNDFVDLSGFSAKQLVDAKGNTLKNVTINTEAGNDVIVGSVIDDVITGGAGENTLDYTPFVKEGENFKNIKFGTDTYKVTANEALNLELNANVDSYGNEQVVYEKVGNNIEATVYKQEAEYGDVRYHKTEVSSDATATVYSRVETTGDEVAMAFTKEAISGDTVATVYSRVETTGDNVAMAFTYDEVDANNTPEGEGEHEGQYKKVTHHFKRDNNNENWIADGDDTIEYEEAAVVADTTYYKSTNGVKEALTEEPTDFSDEGKFNQYVKTYKRNDGNTDWEQVGETEETKVNEAVVGSDVISKSVNGGEAEVVTETDFSDEGKFNKSVTTYKRNDENNAWEQDGNPIETLAAEAVVATNEFYKWTNGEKEALTEEPEDFSDEGKFNQYVKTYKRNNENNDWEQVGETEETKVDEAVVASDVISKSVNGGGAEVVTETDFSDEGKYREFTTVSNWEKLPDAYRDLTNDDLSDTVKDIWSVIDNVTIKRDLVTEGESSDFAEGVTYVAGKGVELEEGRLITQDDLNEGLIFVSAEEGQVAQVKDNEEAEARALNAETDLTAIAKARYNDGTYTIDYRDIEQTDLADSNLTLLDQTHVSKVIDKTTDLTESAAAAYSPEKGILTDPAHMGWKEGQPEQTDIIDEHVETVTTYQKLINGEKNDIAWDPEHTPTEDQVGENVLTGTSKVDYTSELGTIVLEGMGKNNNLADVTVDDEAFWTNKHVINIDGTKGGNITGTKGYDYITLGEKAATLTETAGYDIVTGNVEKSELTYTLSSDVVQNFTDADDYLVNANATTFSYQNKESLDGAEFNTLAKTTIVDASKAKYSVSFSDGNVDFSKDKGNNLLYVKAKTVDEATAGVDVKTGKGNDVVILGSAATTEGGKNTINYTGGADAYQGSTGVDEYTVASMNKNTALLINDLGGSDKLTFSSDGDVAPNLKNMTIFFDVNDEVKTTDQTSLMFINDDVLSNNKSLLALFNGTGKGAVELANYFAENKSFFNNDEETKTYNQETKGAGCIEQVKFAGDKDPVSLDSKVAKIAENVAAWLENNGNYDSAMDVIDAGNAADIQSLMLCYQTGSVA